FPLAISVVADWNRRGSFACKYGNANGGQKKNMTNVFAANPAHAREFSRTSGECREGITLDALVGWARNLFFPGFRRLLYERIRRNRLKGRSMLTVLRELSMALC